MKRITNRTQNTLEQNPRQAIQVQYVEKHVEVPVEKIVERVVYVDKPAEIVEKIVYVEQPSMDLTQVRGHIARHEAAIHDLHDLHKPVYNELEAQRRVLVALKDQRAVDRIRRLQFIKRVKKERDEMRKLHLKLKLAIGLSILIATIALFK